MNIGRIKERSKVRRRENHNETKRSKVEKEVYQRRGIRSASVHVKESASRKIYPREDSAREKYQQRTSQTPVMQVAMISQRPPNDPSLLLLFERSDRIKT
jgi:hypothetical protein